MRHTFKTYGVSTTIWNKITTSWGVVLQVIEGGGCGKEGGGNECKLRGFQINLYKRRLLLPNKQKE